MKKLLPLFERLSQWFFASKKRKYIFLATVDFILIISTIFYNTQFTQNALEPLVTKISPLQSISNEEVKSKKEVFGFAPYWTFDKLGSVNFDVLTTLSYFGVEVGADGNLVRDDIGYQTFRSSRATEVFKKAHNHGTRVVLTITQMNNRPILSILDNPGYQKNVIDQTVYEVKNRGIDGINVDFEYMGDPGTEYRRKFTKFVADLTEKMHQEVPASKVTVSVYASAIKEPKIYDISGLSQVSDGIFMMAYDFAVAGSDHAIPTSPLYGYKEGEYWYDVSTAVDDFLAYMPADKLILGVPWYGYNYLVYQPEVKAQTRPGYTWRGVSIPQTYGSIQNSIGPGMSGASNYLSGWDEKGQVGWKAYYANATATWRMIFIEDRQSLSLKYDFVKNKNLGGVGMWALGFEEGQQDMWDLLVEKFGVKFADNSMYQQKIGENN